MVKSLPIRKSFFVFLLLTSVFFASGLVAVADETSDDALIVRAIAVEGNTQVDEASILENIQSTKVGEPVDVLKLREDAQRIVDMGYFLSVDPRPMAFLDGVKIVFTVREFPVINGIDIKVEDDVVPAHQVEKLLGIEVGKVPNMKHLSDVVETFPWLAADQLGFLMGAGVEMSGDRLIVQVAPYRVGEIVVEGNEKTKDEVILREITLKPGDVISMEALRTSLRKLGQLGYFEPIMPEFLPTSSPLVVDLLFPVTEIKTGRASFGAGYSSRDGLLGYIEVSDRNLFGRGQTANIKWEFGGRSNTYDLGFSEPYLFGTETSFGTNIYNTSRTDRDLKYTARSSGADITFGRPLGTYTRGFLTLKGHNTERDPQAGSPIDKLSSRTRSVVVNTRTDTTDHLYYPTEGLRHDFSVEAARPVLGGDTDFTKYLTSISRYVKVGSNNQTLAFRAMVGIGTGDLPPEEEFRVGGSENLRGYRYGEMRGNQMFVAQGEYRIPINDNVSGVVFLDMGNAWKDGKINLGDLKVGGGIGIRFDTALGIIRLDYGIGERGGEAYFSLGPTF